MGQMRFYDTPFFGDKETFENRSKALSNTLANPLNDSGLPEEMRLSMRQQFGDETTTDFPLET